MSIFGKKFFPVVCFLLAAFVTCVGLLLLMYVTFLDPSIDTTAQKILNWIIVILCVAIGILVGYLFTKVPRICTAFMGGWGGYVIGMLINSIVQNDMLVLVWSIEIACTSVFAIISIIWWN